MTCFQQHFALSSSFYAVSFIFDAASWCFSFVFYVFVWFVHVCANGDNIFRSTIPETLKFGKLHPTLCTPRSVTNGRLSVVYATALDRHMSDSGISY